MAATSTYEMLIKIGAKFAGTGFTQAQREIHKTENATKSLRGSFTRLGTTMRDVGKIATGVFAGGVAIAVARRVAQVATAAGRAGVDVLDIHEKLRISGEKAARHMERTQKARAPIESQTAALIKQAEALEKTGHDAEELEAVIARIQESGTADMPAVLNFESLQKIMPLLSDLLSKTKGLRPGMEGAHEAGEMLVNAIREGNLEMAKALDIPLSEQKAFRAVEKMKISGAAKEKTRLSFVMKWLKSIEGETKKIFGTPAGAMRQAEIQREGVLETLGAVDKSDAMRIATRYRNLWKTVNEDVAKFMAEQGGKEIADAMFTALELAWQHRARMKAVFAIPIAAWDLGTWIADNWDPWWTLLQAKLISLQGYFTGVWDEIWLKFEVNFAKPFKDWWNGLPDWLTGPLGRLYDAIINKFKEIWKAIQTGVPWWMQGGAPAAEPAKPGTFRSWTAPEPSTGYPGVQKPTLKAEDTWTPGPSIPPRPSMTSISNNVLAAERARLAAEYLNNPAIRQRVAALTAAEVGGQGAEAQQAFIETIFNRAAARKQSLDRTMQANYYATMRGRGLRPASAAKQAEIAALADKVIAGSDVAQLATGNFAYAGRGYAGGYGTRRIGGEQFSVQGADKAWAARVRAAKAAKGGGGLSPATESAVVKMIKEGKPVTNPWFRSMKEPPFWGKEPQPTALKYQKSADVVPKGSRLKDMIREMTWRERMSGATGGQNVANLSPRINIHAGSDEHGRQIAAAVTKAMESQPEKVLAMLKKARDSEARFGYT
jgi:hypothetical protein